MFTRPSQAGFTLIEMMSVMGIFLILTAFMAFNILRPQQQASLDTAVTTLQADLKSQQIRAMAGDADTTSSAKSFGVYLEPTKYTLFTGTSFSAADTSNYVVTLDPAINLVSINVPSTQIIFSPLSGEMTNFSSTQTTFIVRNINTNEQKTLTINRYGIFTIQ
jgi:prepilin-type N-terminal cleavage/methylation domain-containing protein